jgi:hypothetical protein
MMVVAHCLYYLLQLTLPLVQQQLLLPLLPASQLPPASLHAALQDPTSADLLQAPLHMPSQLPWVVALAVLLLQHLQQQLLPPFLRAVVHAL